MHHSSSFYTLTITLHRPLSASCGPIRCSGSKTITTHTFLAAFLAAVPAAVPAALTAALSVAFLAAFLAAASLARSPIDTIFRSVRPKAEHRTLFATRSPAACQGLGKRAGQKCASAERSCQEKWAVSAASAEKSCQRPKAEHRTLFATRSP